MEVKKNFFSRDTLKVARELLGKTLKLGTLSGKIVETEAYKGYPDEASHASKRTKRSSIMFDTFGKYYVYFIYGNYYCLNITTEAGKPGAVLIRAVEPLTGLNIMKKRRNTDDLFNLANGPSKLCQAFGIGKSMNDTEVNDKISIIDNNIKPEIASSIRIGIKKATNLKWRFYIKDNNFVSNKPLSKTIGKK